MQFVTINDISRKAGVSKATVSRVLNNPDIVEPATRKRILDIMEELHYVPSAAARNLSKSSSATIGAVVADIANPFLSELLKGVLHVCNKKGYTLICTDNSDDPDLDFKALNSMKEQRVAGLIYAPAVDYAFYGKTEQYKLMIKDLNAPVVLVDRRVCWDENSYDGVFFNDYDAIRKAVKRLVSAGKKRIAFINSNEKNVIADTRLNGYIDGILTSGLTIDRSLVFTDGKYTVESGYRQTRKMLELEELPDAVITCNNLLSKGYLQAIYESPGSKAKRITFVGLDQLDMMDTLGIKYNHIERDAFLMGKSAAEQLFWRMKHPNDARHELILEAPLISQTF